MINILLLIFVSRAHILSASVSRQRDEKRKGWAQRCREKLYSKQPVSDQPMAPPIRFGPCAIPSDPRQGLLGAGAKLEREGGGMAGGAEAEDGSRGQDQYQYQHHLSPLAPKVGDYVTFITLCKDAFSSK